MTAQTATIFVSIASYRDRECRDTLADLFAKAAHPERLAVGVLWQVDPEQDGALYTEVPCCTDQVRGQVLPAAQSRGPCWARHWIQSHLYRGEDFYLQIDSHTRFVVGWDEQLLSLWESAPAAKPVLSTLPPPYHPPDERVATGLTFIRAERFKSDGNLVQRSGTLDPALHLPSPRPSPFLSAAFLFAAGRMVREVPYDPFLYFYGEELTLAVRLWTHGYDIFVPNRIILYHNYGLQERVRHWDDHPEEWLRLQQLSQRRRLHLLGMAESDDPEVLQALDSYALGVERTLAEYEQFADVDFVRRRLGVRALDGRFPVPQRQSQEQAACRKIFRDIYLSGDWGSVESRSGRYALWRKTEQLRRSLQHWLPQLAIRTLVDAGCGDGNWLAWLEDALWDLYLGVDVVPELIHNNQLLFAHHPQRYFKIADLCRDPLPRMDAVLCRQVMPWLALAQAREVLLQCKKSESRYLLATTYPGADNRESATGQWRRLDLTRPPFSLPAPLQLLPDGQVEEGGFLGVWRLADVSLATLTAVSLAPVDPQLLFAPLHEEWLRWQEAGLSCTLWWRDDDLTALSANYWHLQQLAERYALPVLLAVIPATLCEKVVQAGAGCNHLQFCQHGFSHANHQSPGKSQSEFGSARTEAQVSADLAAGWVRLQTLLGERLLPVFVPPWNNYPEERLPLLAQAGFVGISQYGPLAAADRVAAGLKRYNAHMDLIDWSLSPPQSLSGGWLVERLVSKLRQRRLGELDVTEPLGILTHHRVMDRWGWQVLEALFVASQAFPGVRWASARQLFMAGSVPE
ncbi:MAG: hypothetical protein HQM04_05040 [Magnetococcales bacterium]|nr:hypothetical protein [Magnetococcales bacterium]MBF0114391.1 hypothetical protein [Magnetococcales bacterium]